MPVLGPVIGIEGIDTIVRRRHVDRIVRAAANAGVRHHQRLCVDLVINRDLEQQAELGSVYIGRRQYGFIQVLPGSPEVIVLGDNTDLGRCRHIGQQ